MHLLKACLIAFSIYSKIPVPQFAWKEEDMRYMLCFFPWVGAAAGICICLWDRFCVRSGLGILCSTLIRAAIPLAVTGGFHVDGFMDTMDAFHSYQPREKKLEILKDAHIGAFAVIMSAVCGLVYLAAFSEIKDERILKTACLGFFFSRCLSGIGVVSFPAAKADGMLSLFADRSAKKTVRAVLCAEAVCCAGAMLLQSFSAGVCTVAAALAVFRYYYCRCKKELGGITGDTAGYFVVVCEGGMLAAAALCDCLMR